MDGSGQSEMQFIKCRKNKSSGVMLVVRKLTEAV